MPSFSSALKFAAAGLCVWLAIFFIFPNARPHLDAENHLAENATVVLLGVAAALGFFLVFKCSKKSERLLAGGIGLAALVGVADELSLGEGFFQSTVPMIGETRIDGLHDIIQVVWDQKWLVVLILLATGWLSWKHRHTLILKFRSALKSPPLAALMLVVIFVAAAQFFDLHIFEFAARHAVEEYLELISAAALCLCLVALARHGLPDRREEGAADSAASGN